MTDNLPQNAEKSIKKTEGLTEKEQERLSDWREKSQDMKLNYRQKIVPEDGEPANYYQPIKKEGVDHKTICDLAEADHYRLLGICNTQTTRELMANTALTIMKTKSDMPEEDIHKEMEKSLQAIESLLLEMQPKDVFEAMLCLRMISLHYMGTNELSNAVLTKSMDASNQHTIRASKLLRLWNEAKDRLDKHRKKEDQKVVVEHVHVNAGGQAIVGSVSHHGGIPQNRGGNT